MTADPFADDYDAENNTEENPVADDFDTDIEIKDNDEAGASTAVSLTFKGDGNFHSPWIVLRGATVADVRDQLGEELKELMKESAAFAKGYYTLSSSIAGDKPSGGQGGGGKPARQEAPAGEKRFCEHGEMEFKAGISKKSGKPYQMFVCTHPNRDAQCKAQFLN